jgi:hypothetical protein
MSSPDSPNEGKSTSTVKLHQQLTHREVDRVLRVTHLFRQSGWPVNAAEHITIDMSAVEFSDLAACSRLITAVEGAVRHGKILTIVPPAANLRPGERDLITGESPKLTRPALRRQCSRVATSVQARRRGRAFLANTGFFSALQLSHLNTPGGLSLQNDESAWSGDIEKLLSDVTISDMTAALPVLTSPSQFRGSEAILPFTWLTSSDSTAKGEWEERLIEFLHGHDLILTRHDAISIVTTVLRELVDNVFEHANVGEVNTSNSPAALIVGLVVRQGRSLAWKRPGGLYPADLPFNEWLARRETPLVRIMVADSGVGIPATLNESYIQRSSHRRTGTARSGELILHSFEPAASRHTGSRRGLGLATVGRFVRGYAGRVTIRSGNASGGYWYPHITSEAFVDDSLAYTPGTTVEVALGMTLGARPHGPIETAAVQAPANLIFARTGDRAGDRAGDRDRLTDIVSEALRRDDGPHPILVLVISGWPGDRSHRTNLALEVRATAKALERRSGLVIVLPSASEPDIRSTFAPLDELGEAEVGRGQIWDLGDWTPPALIIAANGSAVWAGGSERMRKLLYSLLGGHSVDLDRAVRSFRRRSAERDYLLVERDWLSVDEEAKASLRVTLAAIDELVAERVEATLLRALARSEK